MKKFLKIVVTFSLVLVVGYFGIIIYANLSEKLDIESANGYYLYDSNGERISQTANEWVSLSDISQHLIDATISTEDKNFYKHNGFDFKRILKALFINISSRKTLQGASTITQQYAKNLFLDFDKTWSRKIEEALLTFRLEAHYSKDEILEGYLNTINYGGVFGIANASKYYFNKDAKDLTLAEATILAGIPKSPSNYSPISNPQNAKERQNLILKSMVKNNYISEKEKEKAYNTELSYTATSNKEVLSSVMYYQDAVINELKLLKEIPSSFLETGGLKIYTNLDIEAQKILEDNINLYLQDTQLQTASVIMNPNTGEIIAIAGGKDYSESEFNRVISSKRQVGSTIKPFLYYTALENGFTASTTFTSQKTTFTFGNKETYSPSNYNETYANKEISMATAIAYSDNIYAVKTHLFLGEDNLVDFMKRLGVKEKLKAIPSLALGTNEINILEMMKAYSTFANEGYKIEPHFIKKVEDKDGNVLYEYKEEKENTLNKSIVFILNNLLSNSYSNEFIDYSYPTCINIAPKISKTYAIKTGTTKTDHMMFGYNKDVIMGIWVGYDDNRESELSDGNLMKNIWIDTMEQYLKDKKDAWYKQPENVVGVLVDPISGDIATEESPKKKIFYYIKGTEPSSTDNLDSAIATITENETET